MSEGDSLFTCRNCQEPLDLQSNLWLHSCFDTYDDIDYVIVSNNENKIYAVLKTELSVVPNETSSTQANVNNNINVKDAFDQDKYDEALILAVQKKPTLWNNKLPVTERSQLKKNINWLAVCTDLGIKDADSIAKAKQRWESLRNRYIKIRRQVREYKPSGSAASEKKNPSQSFKFYKIMEFLKDSTDPVPTVSSISKQVSADTEKINEKDEDPKVPDFYTRKSRKRAQKDDSSSFDSEILACLKENKPMDGIDGFLIQVGEIMRVLPEESRLSVQIEILSLLNEKKKNL